MQAGHPIGEDDGLCEKELLSRVTAADERGVYNSNPVWHHELPINASVFDRLLFLPLAVVAYLRRLCDTFGWRYVALVGAVYGLSQGLGEELMYIGKLYYFKDNLKLEPVQAEVYSAIAHTPWNIKPIYGLLSDNVPIFGAHRSPYILIAGFVGSVSWLTLALPAVPVAVAIILLTAANFSIASPDVMVDASVAEHCRTHPRFAADLQTLCWGSLSVGGILGCLCSGSIEAAFGARGCFFFAFLTSVAVLVPALLGWTGEKKVASDVFEKVVVQDLNTRRDVRNLIGLASIVAISACIMAYAGTFGGGSQFLIGTTTVMVGVIVASATYWVLAQINGEIAKPAIFIFLRAAIQPSSSSAIQFWYTDYEGGPKFSPQFMASIDCVGFLSMLAGVSLYNRYMCEWKYRTIFTAAQIFLIIAGLSDALLYTRTNLALGIPDYLFVLGEEAILPLVGKFFSIPMFVLAAKVCPKGVEATLFALLMSLSNFGSDVGRYLGVAMISALNISRENYDNLVWTVVVRAFSKVIVLFLIHYLVPDARPSDPLLPSGDGWQTPSQDSNYGGGQDEDEEEPAIQLSTRSHGNTPTRRRGPGGGRSFHYDYEAINAHTDV